MSSNQNLKCIQAGKHTWSSTAGGYWCLYCRLFIADQNINDARSENRNDQLDELLQTLSKDKPVWVNQLHFWTGQD